MQKFVCLLLSCFFLPFILTAQSPWTRDRGGWYAQAAWHFIPEYTSLFGPDGTSIDLERPISENTFELYGEYGLTRKTTVMASVPLRYMHSGEPTQVNQQPITSGGYLFAPGNVSLAVRRNILNRRLVVSAQLRADLPTAQFVDELGLRTGYDAATILPTASAGMGFNNFYWFAYGGVGFRTNNYSHFIDAGVEAGLHLSKIWVIGFSQWVGPFENGTVNLPITSQKTGLFVNNQGYVSIGLKGIVELGRHFGVVLSAAGAAGGQWVPQQPGLGIGAYMKWK